MCRAFLALAVEPIKNFISIQLNLHSFLSISSKVAEEALFHLINFGEITNF